MDGQREGWTAEAVLDRLESLGSEENRAGMGRYGIAVDRAYGVPLSVLRPFAKELGRDHDLAVALWRTGMHEARLLASIVDEPKRVTAEQIDAWTADFDSWDICDQCCSNLYRRTPYAHGKVSTWIADEREFVRRAGFALIAVLAVHDKKAEDEVFLDYLETIEANATDPRNFVRKAVNWALRQIGKRSMSLHGPALAAAERLAASDDKTERWIGRDAVREFEKPATLERLEKKAAKG